MTERFENINEKLDKVKILTERLARVIADGSRVPEDYTHTENGDTLLVSVDKAFRNDT